jgi:hypothetical protein
MTTITAQPGSTARRPRGTATFIAALAVGVLAIGAAVTLPRVFSSEPTSTQPAVVAPAANNHTSEHSGDSVDMKPGPLQPQYDPPRKHGAVL